MDEIFSPGYKYKFYGTLKAKLLEKEKQFGEGLRFFNDKLQK